MRDTSGMLTGAAGNDSNGDAHVAVHHGRGALSRSQLSALVGEELGLSEWICIDQSWINAFADVTRV